MGSQRYLAGASVRSVDQLRKQYRPDALRKARRRARRRATGEAPAKAAYKLSKNLNVPPPNAAEVARTPVSHPLVSILGLPSLRVRNLPFDVSFSFLRAPFGASTNKTEVPY